MLKLGNYRVNWQHFNPHKDYVILDKYGRKYTRQIGSKEFFGTKCFIYPINKEEGELLSVGISKLHRYTWERMGYDKYDTYDKEIGRRMSLGKALASLDLTKDEKREIWNDYKNRV